MQTNTATKRIGWIDALRGFTMILVVFYHVEIFSLGIEPDFGLNGLFKLFRMPLFFFISGFIAYRSNELWDAAHYRTRLLKKARIQLIPVVFFGLLYTVTCFAAKRGITPLESINIFVNDPGRLGYWFPIVLFEMFFIYYTVSFLLRNSRLKVRQIALVLISVVLYCFAIRSITQYEHIAVARWFCLYNFCLYFQFFILGNIVSHYKEKVFNLLGNAYIMAIILLLFVGFLIMYWHQADVQNLYIHTYTSKLLAEAISYLGILTILSVFKHYAQFFSKETKVGSCLQYIGQRTFDIYLLHAFLLPTLPMLGAFFIAYNNIALEASAVLVLSLLVILFCLIVSHIVRVSPLLAHWLFGVKWDRTTKE